ncbi:hypothetical protein [Microbacterium sp. PRC9]|uniref:hypothetical protein n=1 Tax=Microbacterium sp. PRC9 TaxID=2962591 RepID=UPI00288148BD|nr:hypothetical protein [Microbacterium sp. PRC9]MDT0143079.1 hypothetical protein [Microbacterium sp. PRC9]
MTSTPAAPPPASLVASGAPVVTTASQLASFEAYRRQQAVDAIAQIQRAYREGRAIPRLV